MDFQEPLSAGGQAKQATNDAKNVYLLTSQNPEAICSTLALFYTLRNLGKNVNLLIDSLPENLKFLSPSLDFISYPKNFVISLPNKIAKISQVYYEKNDEALKIHLTLESGNIKKDNIAFYFSETKPDLIITVGVKDYAKEISDKLDSFGFLLDSPIVNIDNGQSNQKFGKINLLTDSSLSQLVFELIKAVGPDSIKKELAACLLAGIVIYTDNFKQDLNAEVFEASAELMKKGADLKEITKNIYGRN